MDSIQELVNRVMNETCNDALCEHWGKYSCEACPNHMCVEHCEKCGDCGARLCLGCYPDHAHCKGCDAVGKLFYGFCGMCDAIRNHQQHEISRACEEMD